MFELFIKITQSFDQRCQLKTYIAYDPNSLAEF